MYRLSRLKKVILVSSLFSLSTLSHSTEALAECENFNGNINYINVNSRDIVPTYVAGTLGFPLADLCATTYVTLEAGRSYDCSILPGDVGDGALGVGMEFDAIRRSENDGPYENFFGFNLRGDATPAITAVAGALGTPRNTRATLVADVTGMYSIHLKNTNIYFGSYRVECWDTTLLGSFNTFVAQYNFLELSNRSNVEISGNIVAKNFSGETVFSQSFTTQAGRRVDVDLHSVIGSGQYGDITITHDGPLGALDTVTSQYQDNNGTLNLVATRKFDTIHRK